MRDETREEQYEHDIEEDAIEVQSDNEVEELLFLSLRDFGFDRETTVAVSENMETIMQKLEDEFTLPPYGPLSKYMDHLPLDIRQGVAHLAESYIFNTFADLHLVNTLANQEGINTPLLIAYSFTVQKYEEANGVPEFCDLPHPVVNVFMDYKGGSDTFDGEEMYQFIEPLTQENQDESVAIENHPECSLKERSAEKPIEDGQNLDAADAILNVLLNSPADFERKAAPSGIRQNFMCTFNREVVPMETARADDNGAYVQTGCPKRWYYISNDKEWKCTVARQENGGVYYINERVGSKYEKKFVRPCDVYQLTRTYRQNKCNPEFVQMFATVRQADHKDEDPYYLMSYNWKNGDENAEKNFVLSRHGNAKRPHATTYMKQNPAIKKKAVNMLSNTASCAKVYRDLIKEAKTPNEEPCNPKFVHNIKARKKVHVRQETGAGIPECETLVQQMRNEKCNIESVVLMQEHYVSFCATNQMLADIDRFCVHGNSVFIVDTTFELSDGFWLTDSSFSYEALVNEKGIHPVFPGPYMWHFRKDRRTYRRFALEMTYAKPALLSIKKVGHDLDNAIGNGLTDILRDAEKLFCTEHMQKNDERRLKEMSANASTTRRIMADIYGTQHGCVAEQGLADAIDPEDFDAKLESLKPIWDGLLPNFHAWFMARRAKTFKANLVLSARSQLNIKGRFYTNGLESGHRLQKKFLAEESHNESRVAEVNKLICQWVEEFYTESVRALRGLGRYRLANGYETFFVEPTKWNQWSPQRRQQHADQFFAFIPSQSQCYRKPASAGLKKPPKVPRRVSMQEPEIFIDRTITTMPQPASKVQKVTPIKLKKSSTASPSWAVTQQANMPSPAASDPLNPDRLLQSSFELVHRSDHKNCPISVKRCQSCKRIFTTSDWVVVKTEGLREWTAVDSAF
eukprot:gene13682-biopygen10980